MILLPIGKTQFASLETLFLDNRGKIFQYHPKVPDLLYNSKIIFLSF